MNGVPDPDRVRLLDEVAHLARRTRQAQKEYFRSRDAGDLRVSKDYERRLDTAIERLFAAPTLFDATPED